MTTREATPVYVDAATVFAEGRLSAFRDVANLLGRRDMGGVPPELHHMVRAAWATVIHNQWLAEQGRPVDIPPLPNRDVLMARVHAFLATFPDVRDDYRD